MSLLAQVFWRLLIISLLGGIFQKWIQEKYGFHVTNLNIARVKQEYGIIERENYNKPKSEDSKQPGCPEEKKAAIEEALRFFHMIG